MLTDEDIQFACYLTGHDEETIRQIFKDYQPSPNTKAKPVENRVMPKINGQCNTCKKEIENITDHEKFYYKTQTGNFKMVICCFDCQLQLTNSES